MQYFRRADLSARNIEDQGKYGSFVYESEARQLTKIAADAFAHAAIIHFITIVFPEFELRFEGHRVSENIDTPLK